MKTHGATYWMIVGWWWAPLKWAGRVDQALAATDRGRR